MPFELFKILDRIDDFFYQKYNPAKAYLTDDEKSDVEWDEIFQNRLYNSGENATGRRNRR